MQIAGLPMGLTVLLDCAAWTAIQTLLAFLCARLPVSALDPGHWLFRAREWERGGAIYERLFRVRAWKSRLPSGASVFGGFPMKRFASRERNYLERWLRETCRSELMHWLAFLSSGLFFLWNPAWLGSVMVLYAVAANMSCIVAQRHGRPRIAGILGAFDRSTREAAALRA
ncbi:hypothetical protein GX411_08890 [Candidatus Fermentibacteria bacterium]|nr:hypothetical protein [Candidatus Fermentibacteria bacterium]